MLEQLTELIKQQILENEFASGGLVIGLLGSLIALLRHIPYKIWMGIRRHLFVYADVTDNSTAYNWVIAWISRQNLSKRTKKLTVTSSYNDDTNQWDIIISVGPGNHLLRYKRKFIWLEMERREPEGNMSEQFEKLTLRTWGWNKKIIRNLFEDAYELYRQDLGDKIQIYTPSSSHWKEIMSKHPRRIESVILRKGLKEEIIGDIQWFVDNENWYRDRGVPYRRGYLLYGPPGTGKSSLASAIAGEFGMNLYIIQNVSSLSDDYLNELLNRVPSRNVILIEDIDVAGAKISRESSEVNNVTTLSGNTMSGLLNAIDGVASQEGSILVVTTNHIDKLDDALIRPGRIDRVYRIDKCDEEQIYRMYVKFIGTDDGFDEWRTMLLSDPTPAEVQGALLQTKLPVANG